MAKDQDTGYIPGRAVYNPETGEVETIPPVWYDVDNYEHNAVEIQLDIEGFELGSSPNGGWELQQTEPGGVKRYQLAVNVAKSMSSSGFGKARIIYRDMKELPFVWWDAFSYTATLTIALNQP